MRASQRVLGRFVALFLGMLAAACTTVPVAGNAVLEGTATYRERMALPEGAIFEASLEDASIADAPADVLGSIRIPAPSVPPISFRIPYDPKRVDAKRNYVVRARIVHEGRLLFTTDTAYLIPSGDAPRVEILLRRASGDAEETTSAVLTGVYTYAADAGWFIECGTGRRLPVAQEGDNAALESAYGEARYAPTAPLLATVEGRIEEREPMEGPVRPTLVVDRFIDIKPGSCEDASAASLENTYWKVMQIRGEPVIVGDRQREPHLILHPHDGRVTGHGGCNSMTGGYAVEDGGISFTQMASTMMACASGMEQERALHDALAAVANWRISGQLWSGWRRWCSRESPKTISCYRPNSRKTSPPMNEELEQLLLNLKLITVAARLLARLPFGTQQLHEQRPYRRTVTLGGGEILLEPAALDARLKRAQLPDVWTLETFPFKVQTGGG